MKVYLTISIKSTLRLAFVCILVFLFQKTFSQNHQIGFTTSFGIDDYVERMSPNGTYKKGFNYTASIGAIAKVNLLKKIELETGMNYNFSKMVFDYHEKINAFVINTQPTVIDEFSIHRNRNLYSVSFPLAVGYRLGNLSLKVGASFFLLFDINDSRSHTYVVRQGVLSESQREDVNKIKTRIYPSTEIAFNLSTDTIIKANFLFKRKAREFNSFFPRQRFSLGFNRFIND